MILRTEKALEIWNEAVRCAAREILKYDGIIPSEFDRKIVHDGVIKHCSRKKASPSAQTRKQAAKRN
jgi:hypothetical protein